MRLEVKARVYRVFIIDAKCVHDVKGFPFSLPAWHTCGIDKPRQLLDDYYPRMFITIDFSISSNASAWMWS